MQTNKQLLNIYNVIKECCFFKRVLEKKQRCLRVSIKNRQMSGCLMQDKVSLVCFHLTRDRRGCASLTIRVCQGGHYDAECEMILPWSENAMLT